MATNKKTTAHPRAPAAGEDARSEDASSTLVDLVTEVIREAILSGGYSPRERLKVADLSRRFNFSAMPIREALRTLEGEGLVEITPNRGATVRQLDRQFIEDLFELNTELRIFAIRRGIKAMTTAKLDMLTDIARDYAAAVEGGDLDASLKLNRKFHGKLMEIGGNMEALRVFQRGWELIGAFRRHYGYGPSRQRGLAREKSMLIEALRRMDLQQAEAILRMQHAAAVEDLIQRFDAMGNG
ncbi:GntR family transcriptional regulator [Castellaniella sp. S9]|uniref:GntR family transcriptional regulator n=1 Tax=Castellaniella sp. S9 TaxID=2993652 RepID=UPI0022B2AF15|nr:GntR family transcriptional regulator [Castellaniella sp. S9]